MLAAWYTRNGAAREVLTVGELPTPEPGPGEVRVRLHASGVNRSDIRGRTSRPVTAERIVPHSDGAGVIDKLGADVPVTRLGERVWIWNGQWQRAMGTAAQYIVVPSNQAVRLPATTDFAAGACLGIPGCTAYQAVRLLGEKPHQTVLVTGATSSVGYYVTQIATQHGHRVIGTVGSAMKATLARNAGAAFALDYKQERIAPRISELTNREGVDAIIDMDFGSTAALLPEGILKARGQIIAYGSNTSSVNLPFDAMIMGRYALQFFHVYQLEPIDREAVVMGLSATLCAGRVQHLVGREFPLVEIAAAHEAVEAGRTTGHVVLTIP